jgi:DNA mismatch repair protein MutS2
MPGVVNASVEFDLETLRPTYHLTVGLPGRSTRWRLPAGWECHGHYLAGALGLNPQDLRAEDLLDEIHRQRDMSRQARQAAETARHEAEALRTELSERLEHIEDERRAVLEKSRQQAEAQIQELQDELNEARQALARARQPLEVVEMVEEQLETLEEVYEKPVERRQPTVRDAVLRREVRLGDKVKLRTLGTQGVVTSLGEEEAEVQVGSLRVRTRLSELIPLAGEPAKEIPERGKTTTSFSSPASPGIELDLRGNSVEDALTELDRYRSAYLAGLPWVRIIHGKGTGKLRLAVRQTLGQHPHVKSFEGGGEQEGGEGVTVAKLHAN